MNGMKGMPTLGGMYGMNRALDWEHVPHPLRHDMASEKGSDYITRRKL